MKQERPMNNVLSIPKSSMPIIVQAIGVCVAPEKTATNPMPAKSEIGSGT